MRVGVTAASVVIIDHVPVKPRCVINHHSMMESLIPPIRKMSDAISQHILIAEIHMTSKLLHGGGILQKFSLMKVVIVGEHVLEVIEVRLPWPSLHQQ